MLHLSWIWKAESFLVAYNKEYKTGCFVLVLAVLIMWPNQRKLLFHLSEKLQLFNWHVYV